MRVALNISSALKRRPTGIARYVESLTPELQRELGPDNVVLGVRPHRWSSRKHSALARRERRRLRPLVMPYRLLLGRIDLLHSFGAWLPTRPVSFSTVVSVHDIHTIDRPELVHRSRAEQRAAKLAASVGVASGVVTPSEFTRGRVIEFFGIEPSRVFAVHHGIDAQQFSPPNVDPAALLRPLGIDRPFILGSGQAPNRKRGDLLIDAWQRSHASEEFDLVLVGGHGAESPLLVESRSKLSRPARVHLVGHVQHTQLVALYHAARCCVFPSEYEGFGLPLLEAMVTGCPLATSDIPAFREVAGSGDETAALQFPVGDIDGCTAAIDELCDNPKSREQLIKRGRYRVAEFSWPEAARATLAAYRSVLER